MNTEEKQPLTIEYLKKMGITTLNQKDENLALALGGLDKGISPLEMAGAYATIANDGIYIEPTFYTKLVAQNGEIITKTKQTQRRAFSKEVAYITKELLTQPVVGKNGTATYCSIAGMDVAAKTGTTNEDYDRWLCGFTNYYTAVTWFGYDLSERINYNGKNPAGIIWASVMNSVHKKLENSKFEQASGVVAKTICKDSLQLANTGCKNTYTEYFLKGTEPKSCTIHKESIVLDDITIDEGTKKKIKDVVKSTVKEVTEDITPTVEEPITTQPILEQPTQEIIPQPAETQENENSTEESQEDLQIPEVTEQENEEITDDTEQVENITQSTNDVELQEENLDI